jgi:hypothetical protein
LQSGYDANSKRSQHLSGQQSPVPDPRSQGSEPQFSTPPGSLSPSRSAESPGSPDRAAGAGAEGLGAADEAGSAEQGSPGMGGSQSPCSSPQQPGSPRAYSEAGAEGRSTCDRRGRATSSTGTGRGGSGGGVRSTWLQFLQQQYSQVEDWGLQRVTAVGCVRRWVVMAGLGQQG